MPCGAGGREWSEAATSQTLLEPPELGEAGRALTLESLEGAQPCRHLDLRLLASRAGRGNTSVILSPAIQSNLHGNLGNKYIKQK